MSDSQNPLDQFNISPLLEWQPGGVDLSFTNSSLMMMVVLGVIAAFMLFGGRRAALVPNRWQAANEMLIGFVQDMARSNAGEEAMKYFPLIFTIFIFILFSNLLGMVPGAFTVTSHLSVTFAISGIFFLGITLLGIVKHGAHFFSLFLPKGTPWWMVWLIIPIELISYFARPVSLAIRLTANMLAGHMLLKIMAGFVAAGIVGIFPFLFLIIFTGFELFVACLQAYIFAMLACIYLNDTLNLH